jgi:DNA-directed RNA polymerase III subunit RPC1
LGWIWSGRSDSAPGVHGKNTLRVEAARIQISNEIQYIIGVYGIGMDVRNLLLLSDIMKSKGEVLGITRYGG